MTLAQQIAELKAIYAAGVLRATLSDGTTVQYASLSELWQAIQRLENLQAAVAGNRVTSGRIRFRG